MLSIFDIAKFVGFSSFSVVYVSFPVYTHTGTAFFSVGRSILTSYLFFSIRSPRGMRRTDVMV